MTAQLWTLGTWAVACTILAVAGSIGQWLWNARHKLKPVREHPDVIPPLAWPAAAGVVFALVALLFIGHAAGLG